MQPTAIILPVAVQAALTLAVLIAMGPARARSMREDHLSLDDRDVRLGLNHWSDQALKTANNYKNQFEMPVLFYAVAAFAMLAGAVDVGMVTIAWIFVLSRIVHAAIHIGPNIVMLRGISFAVGVFALATMWIRLVLHIL
ncbi:MAG: MAPEG family protein [Hyphomicrobiaceae bacterium]